MRLKMNMKHRPARPLQSAMLAALLALGLFACTPREQVHGYLPDADRLAEVKQGVHDKDSIEALLGSPSNVGNFNDKTWYYITRRTEKLAFFKDELKEQKVVAIDFDDRGIVSGVRHYGMEDGRVIEPVERKTPTRGKELTFIEQLLGNLGRFGDPGAK